MIIWSERFFPANSIFSPTISIYNFQTISNLIVSFSRQIKKTNIAYLEFFISRLFPISTF